MCYNMSLFYGYGNSFLSQEIKLVPSTSKNSYNTIFDLNVTKAYDAGNITLNGSRIEMIWTFTEAGQSILSQEKNSMRPEMGNSASGRYISSIRGGVKCAMHYYVPMIQYMNIHYFFVCVKLARVDSTYYDMLMSNDSGSYSRYLGYKGGSDTKISIGGMYPRKEKVCTIPTGKHFFTKHLISSHWQNGFARCRFNGALLNNPDIADKRKNGGTYGTIFANWRPGSYGYRFHSNIQFYGMKIVAGFMTDKEITDMCNDMKTEYNIA